MQTGNRIGYHPELAQKEIAHFHEVLPKAKEAVDKLVADGRKRLDNFAPRHEAGPIDMQAEKQKRADALNRAEKLAAETGNK